MSKSAMKISKLNVNLLLTISLHMLPRLGLRHLLHCCLRDKRKVRFEKEGRAVVRPEIVNKRDNGLLDRSDEADFALEGISLGREPLTNIKIKIRKA